MRGSGEKVGILRRRKQDVVREGVEGEKKGTKGVSQRMGGGEQKEGERERENVTEETGIKYSQEGTSCSSHNCESFKK